MQQEDELLSVSLSTVGGLSLPTINRVDSRPQNEQAQHNGNNRMQRGEDEDLESASPSTQEAWTVNAVDSSAYGNRVTMHLPRTIMEDDDGMESTLGEPLIVTTRSNGSNEPLPPPTGDESYVYSQEYLLDHPPCKPFLGTTGDATLGTAATCVIRRPAVSSFLCAPSFFLGQVNNRMGLNWLGTPVVADTQPTTCRGNPMTIFTVLVMATWTCLALFVFGFAYCDCPSVDCFCGNPKGYFWVVVFPVWLVSILFYQFVLRRTRTAVRERYHIHDNHDVCDDYLMACCCSHGTLMQLYSHTADLAMYRSYWLTATGLYQPRGSVNRRPRTTPSGFVV